MPKLEKLSYFVDPQIAALPAEYSAGAVTAVAVDASGGFDRVQHVVSVGAYETSAGFDVEITESATSGGSYTLITGSGATALVGTAATSTFSKIIILDVPVNNAKPFQKIRGTATTAAVSVCAIANCYNGSRSLGTSMADVQEEVVV